jgi:hypothetical protein
MPFVCVATGEVAAPPLEDSEVIVETNPKTLVSHTIIKGKSPTTHLMESWVFKEESDLNDAQKAAFKKAAQSQKK